LIAEILRFNEKKRKKKKRKRAMPPPSKKKGTLPAHSHEIKRHPAAPQQGQETFFPSSTKKKKGEGTKWGAKPEEC